MSAKDDIQSMLGVDKDLFKHKTLDEIGSLCYPSVTRERVRQIALKLDILERRGKTPLVSKEAREEARKQRARERAEKRWAKIVNDPVLHEKRKKSQREWRARKV